MQNTTNYNFNLPEGTDLWNYLTQTNPNFTALDSILKGVSDATVTTATEVASGTAHAISRTLPDANVIRFTATSNWVLGDTMTIDGTPVTVVNPNGTNLQTGAYVIGAEVLGVIRATQFTVYLGGVSSIDAVDVDYDNTVSGLTATDVQAAIDEEASAIDTINSNLLKFKSLETTVTIASTDANNNSIAPYSKSFNVNTVTGFPSNPVCLVPMQAFINSGLATALLQANPTNNTSMVISCKVTGTYTVRFGIFYKD